MRIRLSNSKKFFDEILLKKNLSLKELSKQLSFNYSNLKQYRRGEKTIPDFIFNSLILISPSRTYWLKDKEELDNNWGGIKGGLIAGSLKDRYKRAAHARKFKKIVKVKLKLNEFFCEFYGALLGDGCISRYVDYLGDERYVIAFSGNKRLDSDYFRYLQKKLALEYGLYAYYYEVKNKNVCTISIKNKDLCLELNKRFNVPIGLKYEKLNISKRILELPWDSKKFMLRGLFDTDGCILANKRESYQYPWIIITSKSYKFRSQLVKILRKEGYPAYSTGKDVCVRGIANVKRWFNDIGSSNSRNILKYEYFLKHSYL